MQWLDILREFPYQSDFKQLGKKASRLVETKIVRDKSYFSTDKAIRNEAIRWLECSATMKQNYKEKFLHALPGFIYLIPEIGRGLFLCICPLISFSDDIPIVHNLYKNRVKYNKDIYVFVNSNVPDRPFLVSRRMISSFFGRSPSENVLQIIQDTMTKIKTQPQLLKSALTILDIVDPEDKIINPANTHDLILIEKTIEASIKQANKKTPINVEEEDRKIAKLIESISQGKVGRTANEDSKESYIDWLLETSVESLRKKLPPEAFALLDRQKLRENIVAGIKTSIDIQKKQTEDWYADENSVIVPGNGESIEIPNIPANSVNSSFNSNGQNFAGKYNPNMNTHSLNAEEKTEIVENKKQGWVGFIKNFFLFSASGGTRKYRRDKGRKNRNKTTLKSGGATALKFLAKRGENIGERRWNIDAERQDQRAQFESEEEKSEYDRIYERVYFKIASRSRDAFEAALVKSSVSQGGELLQGGVIAFGSITAVCGAIAATAPSVWAVGTAAVATVVSAPLAGLALTVIVPTLAAVLVMGSGGFATGYSRAAAQHNACREIVAELMKQGSKPTNTKLNLKIGEEIAKGKIKLFGTVNKPNFETAGIWMTKVTEIISVGLLVAAKVTKNALDKKATRKNQGQRGESASLPESTSKPSPNRSSSVLPTRQAEYVKPTKNPYAPFTPENTFFYFGHSADEIDSQGDFIELRPPMGCVYVNSTICGLSTTEPWDLKIIPGLINEKNDFLLDPFPPENEEKINNMINLKECVPGTGTYRVHCYNMLHHLYEIGVYSGDTKYVKSGYSPFSVYPFDLLTDKFETLTQSEKDAIRAYESYYVYLGSSYNGIMSLAAIRLSTEQGPFYDTTVSYETLDDVRKYTRTPEDWPLPGFYKGISYTKLTETCEKYCVYPTMKDFKRWEDHYHSTYPSLPRITKDTILDKLIFTVMTGWLQINIDEAMEAHKGLHYNFLCRATKAKPAVVARRRAGSVHRIKTSLIDSLWQDSLEGFQETWREYVRTRDITTFEKFLTVFNITRDCTPPIGGFFDIDKTVAKIFIHPLSNPRDEKFQIAMRRPAHWKFLIEEVVKLPGNQTCTPDL
jgi:hypothetical protein